MWLIDGSTVRSLRIAVTAAVVAAGVGGVLVFQGTGDSPSRAGEAGEAGAEPGPVTTDVHTSPLKVSGDGRRAVAEKQDTEPFSMLGVTWTDPASKVETVQVRTRAAGTGAWSGWLGLDTETDSRTEAASSGVRGATEPRWVGPSNGVEVRVVAGGAISNRLPQGLRLDLIDPGKNKGTGASGLAGAEPAAYALDDPTAPPPTPDGGSVPPSPPEPSVPVPSDSAPVTKEPEQSAPPSTSPSTSPSPGNSVSPTPSPTPSTSTSTSTPPPPTGPASTVPRPPITLRGLWGADEAMTPEPAEYLNTVKAVFVHHTAQTNTYDCADSPAIMRGLLTYHVKSEGWKDLGYNFVVDKCGTVFEGRKGGIDLPVFGAHTYGFNRDSAGIAVIGNYVDAPAPQAVLTSVARVAAWKLGQYKGDPAGTTTLTAGATGTNFAGKQFTAGTAYPFSQISGHRDAYNTLCPGTLLYNQIPALRTLAAGPVAGLAVKSITQATLSGTTYYTRGPITVSWTATTPTTLIAKNELLVDGKPAATAQGTDTTAKATLAAGKHTVQIRSTHQSGTTTTTPAATVIAETTAPVFTTKPTLALRTGTVDTAAVPLTLNWKATDSAALKEVRQTAPTAKTYGPTVTSAPMTAKSGAATNWSLTAHDQAGNTTTATTSATPVILQETAATKTGTWTAKSSPGYLGGKSLTSSTKNASLTWTFTGRSAAWIVSRSSTSGQATVYVDGVKTATVDLKTTGTKYRDAIWTKTWPTSTKHTIKITVTATTTRPTITTDGLTYLK
ncbi:peptidoglycan recognition protein family protein [Streptomyces liangshanensis]|uniref:peptidoglycan recognition protein family protein n=1 Tax=Streptomyces liangshanensis TaxID=2717324 RepID=UPI0036DD8EB1